MTLAMSDGRQGYILAHDFVFNASGTAAAVQFQQGQSRLTGAEDTGNITTLEHATQIAKPMLETAQAVFDGALEPDSPEGQLIDQFEQLVAG